MKRKAFSAPHTILLLTTALACMGQLACGSAKERFKVSKGAIDRPVDPAKELMIRDLSVVEDSSRATDPCDAQPGGQLLPWDFGTQMTNLASLSGESDPSAFVLRWLQTWETDQTVNTFVVANRRQGMDQQILNPWLQASGGSALDLALAPFRLLAVSFRVDLRQHDDSGNLLNAGEGRFVYGLVPRSNCTSAESMTVIFEYKLVAQSNDALAALAAQIHALGDLEFGTPDYNAALQALTDVFTSNGITQDPASGQVRTNEIALSGIGQGWELREFKLGANDLLPATIKNTPDPSLNNSTLLSDYINANIDAILAGTHSIPETFEDQPLRGANAPTPTTWNAPNINDNANGDVREQLSLNTCNGCHATETATGFTHVTPRARGRVAPLSRFLTGETVVDPVSRVQRMFADLDRRATDLAAVIDNGGG